MPKINQFPGTTTLATTDVMVTETSTGTNTRKIAYSDFRTQIQNESKSVFALKGEIASDAQVAAAVTDWLDANVTPTGSTVAIDDTLLIQGAAADAKATGEMIIINGTSTNGTRVNITTTNTDVELAEMSDVNDLKNALNYFENGKHFFTYEIIPNSYPDANGVFQPFNNWDRTDYIEVIGGQRIYFYNTLGQTNDNAWYDANKTFISRFSIVVGSPTYADAPSNAKYMVVSNQRIKWFGDIYAIQDYYATKVDLNRLLYRYIAKLDSTLFEHGSLANGKDSVYNEGSRIRTPIICNDADIVIKTHGGTERVLIQTFDADGTYASQLGWYESITIKRGTIFRLLLTTDTTSSATVSINDILSHFDILYSDPWSDRPDAVDLFEKGSLTSADGQNSTWNADARARTKTIWTNSYDMEVSTKNGAFIIYYFNSDGSFAFKTPDNPTTWYYNKTYIIPANTRFRILISLDPSSSSNVALETIVAGFTFKKIESRYEGAVQKIYPLKRHFNTDESTKGTWTNYNNDSLFTLAHISDMHADVVRYQNFYNFYKANSGIIDAAIQTGDLVDAPTDQQFAAMHAIDPNNEIIWCTGNHDMSGNDGSSIVTSTKANVYSKMGLSTNTGELYHYVDFSAKKIRLIVLNDYNTDNTSANWDYQATQLTWFVNTLKDASTNNLSVLIAMHLPESNITANTKGFYTRFYQWDGLENPDYGSYTAVEDIVDAFTRGTSVTTTARSGSFTANFSGYAGTFIAYLTGHRHQDTTGYSSAHSGQLYLNIVNGVLNMGYGRKGRDFTTVSDLPRIEGQHCENAFNIYAFDLVNRVVKVLRVGSDMNDLMEDRIKATYTF